METNNNVMRELLLTTASLISEIRSGFPAGCNGYNEKGGYYTADSVSKVANLNDNVRASDGFIQDGFMVWYREQIKAEKDAKYSGYRVIFELTGPYNGPVSVFTRSSNEYKMYFDPEAWNIRKETIVYKPIDEEDDSEPITRVYLEPQVMDFVTNDWRAADKNCSIENKVRMALKGKLKMYDAYIGDVKMFNEDVE